jgi:hypothetical protein
MMRISFRYPLSESVAPPGTAWGAEGLRGNEANENNLMVLARARARKGQSRTHFAQEDMTVSFRQKLSAPAAVQPMDKKHTVITGGSPYKYYWAATLRVIVKGALEFVMALPPLGAPVVALIVTM